MTDVQMATEAQGRSAYEAYVWFMSASQTMKPWNGLSAREREAWRVAALAGAR